MNLTQHLGRTRSLIDARLDAYLPPAHAYPPTMHRAMRYSVFSGGKRVRPILAIESCRVCGGDARAALPAACAIELVHTYSLIHDDLPAMDDDDIRRGKPTLHRRYGEANAILAGDALLTLAFGIVARYSDASSSRTVAEELARAAGTSGMVGGQAMDIEYADKKKSKKMVEYINLHKTARLFEVSAKIGAVVAHAAKAKADALARFGNLLGLSFQVVDDMIDGGDYVKAYGLARAKENAYRLAKKAGESLRIFGARAAVLRAIAAHLVCRTE